jgi:uncharacterized membrane protein YbhN (UPF0104 family)
MIKIGHKDYLRFYSGIHDNQIARHHFQQQKTYYLPLQLKALLSSAKYFFLFAIGIVLFWLAFRNVDLNVMKNHISHIKFRYIVICFFVSILSHIFRGIRWNMLIRPLGKNVSVKNSFVAVMMGYFANMALPRMGELTRCVVLNRTDKIPVDKLIGTVITERLIDFLSLMLLVLLNFLLEFKRLRDFSINTYNSLTGHVATPDNGIKTEATHGLGLFSGTNLIWLILIIVAVAVIAFVTHRKFKSAGIYGKITEIIKGFIIGMKSVLEMKQRGMFLFYTFLIWFMYYLQVYICFFALDFTENLGPLTALTVLVIGSFGFVAPVQGGIGAYHLAVMSALAIYNISPDDGKTFAFVAHTFQMAVIIIVGGISFIYFTVAYRKKKDEALPDENQIEVS